MILKQVAHQVAKGLDGHYLGHRPFRAHRLGPRTYVYCGNLVLSKAPASFESYGAIALVSMSTTTGRSSKARRLSEASNTRTPWS